MGRKALFFDIDGTLYDFEHGVIESTRRAIRLLNERGHLPFICTGRSRALVEKWLVDLGFVGVVAACGTDIEYQGKRVFSKELTPNMADWAVRALRDEGMVPVLEGPEALYFDDEEYTQEIDGFRAYIDQVLGPRRLTIKGSEGAMLVNKISAKIVPGSRPEYAVKRLAWVFDAIRHEGVTIEFVPKGFSKATGIQIITRALGVECQDILAFGDSNNDLDMLEYAGIGVAMGNGTPQIRERADYVTGSLENDGIWNALQHFGLL